MVIMRMNKKAIKAPPELAASTVWTPVPQRLWPLLLGLSLGFSPFLVTASDGTPDYLKTTGQSNNRFLKMGVLDVTLYNGWEGHAVDPSGQKDSTQALQKAMVEKLGTFEENV